MHGKEKVTGAMITRIAADVHRYRAMPPTIANTDGDPMCLITATIAVVEGAVGKLAARPDRRRSSISRVLAARAFIANT